jgi:ElaB/YqjD/DUF883 family membrane-anchored ribosome-binding protein
MNAVAAIPELFNFLGTLETAGYTSSMSGLAVVNAFGEFQGDLAAYILPKLQTLLSNKSGEAAFSAIQAIQNRCQFYDYKIFRKRLPPVVSPQPSGATVTYYSIDSEVVQIIEKNQGIMTEPSKYNIRTEVNQITEINNGMIIGKQVQASTENLEQLVFDFQQFITNLQQKYPQITNETAIAQIIDVEAKLIETQDKPRWQNILNLKRLWNGSKKAAIKIGEHFVEENPWGKGAIAFLEGVSEEIE